MYTHIQTCIHTFIHHACMHACMHAYIHTHTHTHTHTPEAHDAVIIADNAAHSKHRAIVGIIRAHATEDTRRDVGVCHAEAGEHIGGCRAQMALLEAPRPAHDLAERVRFAVHRIVVVRCVRACEMHKGSATRRVEKRHAGEPPSPHQPRVGFPPHVDCAVCGGRGGKDARPSMVATARKDCLLPVAHGCDRMRHVGVGAGHRHRQGPLLGGCAQRPQLLPENVATAGSPDAVPRRSDGRGARAAAQPQTWWRRPRPARRAQRRCGARRAERSSQHEART